MSLIKFLFISCGLFILTNSTIKSCFRPIDSCWTIEYKKNGRIIGWYQLPDSLRKRMHEDLDDNKITEDTNERQVFISDCEISSKKKQNQDEYEYYEYNEDAS